MVGLLGNVVVMPARDVLVGASCSRPGGATLVGLGRVGGPGLGARVDVGPCGPDP